MSKHTTTRLAAKRMLYEGYTIDEIAGFLAMPKKALLNILYRNDARANYQHTYSLQVIQSMVRAHAHNFLVELEVPHSVLEKYFGVCRRALDNLKYKQVLGNPLIHIHLLKKIGGADKGDYIMVAKLGATYIEVRGKDEIHSISADYLKQNFNLFTKTGEELQVNPFVNG
jgi:hypothetical protein